MGIQINGNTNNINAGIGSLSIEDINELDIVGVATAANFKTGVSNLHDVGLTLTGGQIDVGSNIKIGTAGVVTATSFSGSGANLTSLPAQATIANNADNRVITGGSGVNLNGEANFTYDGSLLTTEKRMVIGNGTDFQIPSRSNTSSYTPQFQITGAWNNPTHGATLALNGRNDYPFIWLNSGASFADNSGCGVIAWSIKDGAGNYCNTAEIRSFVDGTPANNNSPGDLSFRTTPAGTCQSTEKLLITSTGQINATGASTGNPIGITIKNSNTAAYSHARLRLESQNASKYADVWCDIPNNSLRLAYNSSNSLYISQEGNVGLGTATPQNSSGYATLTVSGSTGGQLAFFGSSKQHFIWTDSDALNVGAGYNGAADLRVKTNGNNERLRIDTSGHVSLRNSTNSHQELQWYSNTSKSATIGWGNGSANWEFKHYRADNQADNPYANIDFFTGSTTSPTRALRITEDGNHIREKHSRFATRIDYDSAAEAVDEVLAFKTAHVNVGNDFDASNNYYVAPVDGDYAFWFHTNVGKSGSGAYYASWHKNGSEVNSASGGRMYDQHSGSGWNNLSGCIMLALQEGDQITLRNRVAGTNYDGNSYGQFMGWLVG